LEVDYPVTIEKTPGDIICAEITKDQKTIMLSNEMKELIFLNTRTWTARTMKLETYAVYI